MTKVPSEQIRKSLDLNMKLISNQIFWKLAKYKVATVKAAFFGVLSALGQNAPFLFDSDKKVVINMVFSNLDINEPTVLPLTWETALLIMSKVEVSYPFFDLVAPTIFSLYALELVATSERREDIFTENLENS